MRKPLISLSTTSYGSECGYFARLSGFPCASVLHGACVGKFHQSCVRTQRLYAGPESTARPGNVLTLQLESAHPIQHFPRCLGYVKDEETGEWDNTNVFPKWREKYPQPPDLIGEWLSVCCANQRRMQSGDPPPSLHIPNTHASLALSQRKRRRPAQLHVRARPPRAEGEPAARREHPPGAQAGHQDPAAVRPLPPLSCPTRHIWEAPVVLRWRR